MDLQRLLRSGLVVQVAIINGGVAGEDQVAEHVPVQVEQTQSPDGSNQYRLIGFSVSGKLPGS